MFKEERDELKFDWSMIGNIGGGRPNLGHTMDVSVYRLMQFTLRDVLIKTYDAETADRIFYEAGKHPGREFCKELKMAIVNLVEDKFVVEAVYQKGYDKYGQVTRVVDMWRDHFNHKYYMNKYLQSIAMDSSSATSGYLALIDRYLDDHVDSLQRKYSDMTQIDLDELKKIKLTSIDMTVSRKNAPFSDVVPLFPLVTSDFRLDYGKNMKNIRVSED